MPLPTFTDAGGFFVEKMEAKEEMERKQPTLTSRGIIYAGSTYFYRILLNNLSNFHYRFKHKTYER